MKANIDLEKIESPNVLGEVLRDVFFDQDRGDGFVGCYTTFDTRPGVIPVGIGQGASEEMMSHFYFYNGIVMEYYWDGDGYLSFLLPDGERVYNTDCKKDYTWEWE